MFELEGKYYRKGEEDGINKTTLFRLPKVRINSNLNIDNIKFILDVKKNNLERENIK